MPGSREGEEATQKREVRTWSSHLIPEGSEAHPYFLFIFARQFRCREFELKSTKRSALIINNEIEWLVINKKVKSKACRGTNF
jgi:hypothetical protein